MRIVGMLVLLAGAAVSGYWTWRRTTATMYYRSGNSTIRPSHMSAKDYERRVIVRRKTWRLVKAAIAAVLGGLAAWLLVIMVEGGLSRQ